MKRALKILNIVCMFVLPAISFAKGPQGVYMTASDFINNKLTYDRESKIKLNNSFYTMPYITVVDNGKKIKLEKKAIFGYVDRDKKAYRFYKTEAYQIAEAGDIIIYIKMQKIALSKGYEVKKNFYFSTTASGEIVPLTLFDLEAAYKSNEKFLDLLGQFSCDADLAAYDNTHNTYKVNYVFGKAKK